MDNPLLDIHRYLKYLDDFIQRGLAPEPASVDERLRPWENRRDPLFDFLTLLFKAPNYRQQVKNSRLRCRVFQETVGKFVAEVVKHAGFQYQRAWTERNRMELVLAWTDVQRLDRQRLEQLLNDIMELHRADGFDADFFLKRMVGPAVLDSLLWEKLVHDWREAYLTGFAGQVSAYIERHRRAFEERLELLMKQVTRFVKVRQVTERQAVQAWNMLNNQWTETEFERQLNNVRIQEHYPEIDEVVAKMGRTADDSGKDRLAVASGLAMKMEHASGSDIEGISVGNDLHALLPLELALYADHDMESLFFYKYNARRLQTFKYKSEMSTPARRLGLAHASRRGPMIVCIDTSASMYGTPQRITSSMLALIEETAESLDRDCFLIDFSVSIRPIDLRLRRREKRLERLGLKPEENFAKGSVPFIGGGTSARKLMDQMFELLDRQGGHYVNADVLWVTDFYVPLPQRSYLERLKTYRDTGTKFYGLRIISADDKQENQWESYFNHTYEIHYRNVRRY